MRSGIPLGVLVAAALTGATQPGSPAPPNVAEGLVVERVAPASAAERADLRAGDRLLSWERRDGRGPPAAGRFVTPFELQDLETLQAPRGSVVLRGSRNARALTIALPTGEWGIETHPFWEGSALAAYREASRKVETKETSAAARSFSDLAAVLLAGVIPSAPPGCRGGPRSWARDRRWEEAQQQLEAARAQTKGAQQPLLSAWLWEARGDLYERQSRFPAAEEAFDRARRLRAGRRGEELVAAMLLARNRRATRSTGETPTPPRPCPAVASPPTGNRPGEPRRGQFLERSGHRRPRAGRPRHRRKPLSTGARHPAGLAPNSRLLTQSLTNVGRVLESRGDLEEAEQLFRLSLALEERIAPGSVQLADSLNSLGVLARERQEFQTARDFLARALVLFERHFPAGIQVAGTYNNLGSVARAAGDLPGAEEYYRRSLAIREKLAPDSLDVAASLQNLGASPRTASSRPRQELYRRALAIEQRSAPGSLVLATTLQGLGDVALARGDFEEAGRWQSRHSRSGIDLRRERFTRRFRSMRWAGWRAARGTSRPPRDFSARSHRGLRGAEGEDRRLRGGAHGVRREPRPILPGGDRGLDRALASGRGLPRDGAVPGERASRAARQRRVTLDAEVPPVLARERRRLDGEYDVFQARLSRLPAEAREEEVARLSGSATSPGAPGRIADRIRAASPRLARLESPVPLTAAQARAALDPGTVMLAYSVGRRARRSSSWRRRGADRDCVP